MKLNYQSLVTLVAIGVALFFFMDSCEKKKQMYNQSVAISNYTDSVQTYKDKNGKLIDYNQSMQVNLDVAYDNVAGLEDKIKRLKLKKPEVVIEYKNSVSIDSIDVPIEIPCESFSLTFRVDSPHYSINGLLTDKNLSFKNITVPNEQTFIVAKKRPKWYKRSEYIVALENSNPYVQSTGLQSYTIKPTQKFYQKWYFHVGVGVVGGLLLNNTLK